jgi:hypothetical protein
MPCGEEAASSMPDVTNAFPTRPLGVKPPGMGYWSDFWTIVGALFVSAGCVLLVGFPIPALVDDYGIRDTARPLPGAKIEKGKCSAWQGVIVTCDATLALDRPGQPPLERTEHYFFVDFHFGDYTAGVVADPAHPELMTTDLALDKMTNRVTTMAIGGPFFLGIVGLMIWGAVSSLRRHGAVRRALSGQTLRPVLLKLDGMGPRAWKVSHPLPDGKVSTQKWRVSRRARPIMLDPQRHAILGVTAGDGRIAMPVDAALKWLKLTKAERNELRAALGPA